MKDQVETNATDDDNAEPSGIEYRLVEWTMDKQAADMILLAQKYRMRVVIKFDKSMGVDEARFEMTNPTKVAPNGTMYLTVPSGTIEDEVCIILKRTPSRILRPGTQVIVTFEEKMYWKLPPEPVQARIVDFWENEKQITI